MRNLFLCFKLFQFFLLLTVCHEKGNLNLLGIIFQDPFTFQTTW